MIPFKLVVEGKGTFTPPPSAKQVEDKKEPGVIPKESPDGNQQHDGVGDSPNRKRP